MAASVSWQPALAFGLSDWQHAGSFVLVGLVGGFVGVGELVSRYRDVPISALRSSAAWGYVAINVVASVAALGLILTFDWRFGASGSGVLPTQILMASFGAMALFRTSLFTVRAGNEDVGIGPSSLLSVVLAACDRGVDRDRAEQRATDIPRIMADVSYEAAEGPLPAVALALMQNLDAADQAALGVALEGLRRDETMSDGAKALLLGLALTNVVGPDVLRGAKESLGAEILRPPGVRDVPSGTSDATDGDGALDELLGEIVADRAPETAVEGLPQTPQTPGPG